MPFLSIVNFYYTVLNFKCKKKNNRLNGANERVPESEARRVCYDYLDFLFPSYKHPER